MNEIIEKFILQYYMEYDFYSNLSRITCELCERELSNMGIKAIASWRAKKPESLKSKLLKRDKLNNYKTIDDIKNDIVDFSGVRLALYFPNDRDSVDRLIHTVFDVISKKEFPEKKDDPSLNKRFSGYWATHYRVKIKAEKSEARYCSTCIEIQVASVLMHSWAEIEHDLVYKPCNGKLSDEEIRILDEINGLVMVGEIALERLQKAMSERVWAERKIENSYELKSYLDKYFYEHTNNLGNMESLNNIMKNLNYANTKKIDKLLKNKTLSTNKTIADEITDWLFNDYIKSKKNISSLLGKKSKISGFEKFLKLWILYEKIDEKLQRSLLKSESVEFDERRKSLSEIEMTELKKLRNIRNEIIHGKIHYEDNYLLLKFEVLTGIIRKLINAVEDEKLIEVYNNELNFIIGN